MLPIGGMHHWVVGIDSKTPSIGGRCCYSLVVDSPLVDCMIGHCMTSFGQCRKERRLFCWVCVFGEQRKERHLSATRVCESFILGSFSRNSQTERCANRNTSCVLSQTTRLWQNRRIISLSTPETPVVSPSDPEITAIISSGERGLCAHMIQRRVFMAKRRLLTGCNIIFRKFFEYVEPKVVGSFPGSSKTSPSVCRRSVSQMFLICRLTHMNLFVINKVDIGG